VSLTFGHLRQLLNHLGDFTINTMLKLSNWGTQRLREKR